MQKLKVSARIPILVLAQQISIGSIQFNSNEDKNIVRESGSDNCAARCFEKAGCSAFFVEDGGCTFVIGSTFGEENSDVSESGIVSIIT